MILKKKRCSLWCSFAPVPPIALASLQECVQEASSQGNPSPLIQGSEPMKWKKNCKEKRKGPGDFTQKQIILVTLFLWNLPLPESSSASVGTCRADRTSPSLSQSCGLRPKTPGWDLCWPGSCPGSGPINSGAQAGLFSERSLVWKKG